jgi:S1-C subfamily serine protease
MLKSIDISYCDDVLRFSGKATLAIQWQVYSALRREVVATIETQQSVQQAKVGGRDARSLGQLAFAANVRELLGDEQFRRLVTAPDPAAPSIADAAARPQPIRLISAPPGPVSLGQASGSVVAVFAGGSLGSGVLVSLDGYLLTNHHVVGTAKTVRVRWSDGFESSGQVIRTDKARDVALLKTEPRGRTPLAINRSIPATGATVFAIGTPLDPKLQNTVTRGVVSATRIVNGFNFIQSDAAVTHGNSGGPLVDERGAVVGLTMWGIAVEKGSNLNFFIPIGDALDFLALTPSS